VTSCLHRRSPRGQYPPISIAPLNVAASGSRRRTVTVVSHGVLRLLTMSPACAAPSVGVRTASLNRSVCCRRDRPARPLSEMVRYTTADRRLELAQTMQQLLPLYAHEHGEQPERCGTSPVNRCSTSTSRVRSRKPGATAEVPHLVERRDQVRASEQSELQPLTEGIISQRSLQRHLHPSASRRAR